MTSARACNALAAIVALWVALSCSTASDPSLRRAVLTLSSAEPKPRPMYARPIGPPEKVTPPPDLVQLGKAMRCAPVEVQPHPHFPTVRPSVELGDGQVLLSWCRETDGEEAGTYSVLVLVRSGEHPWARCSPYLALHDERLSWPVLESRDERSHVGVQEPLDLSLFSDFEAEGDVRGPSDVILDGPFLVAHEVVDFYCHEGRWFFRSYH